MSHGLSHDVTTVHDRRLVLKQSGLLKDTLNEWGLVIICIVVKSLACCLERCETRMTLFQLLAVSLSTCKGCQSNAGEVLGALSLHRGKNKLLFQQNLCASIGRVGLAKGESYNDCV